MTVGSIKVRVQNCSEPLESKPTSLRDCSVYLPPTFVHKLVNVSMFFHAVNARQNTEWRQSNCNTVTNVPLTQFSLPEKVYLVCGDKAYSCVPYSDSYGTCYLAYLITLVSRIDASEIAALYAQLHRRQRDISQVDHVVSVFLLWYGVCMWRRKSWSHWLPL